jgi:hypothetical protein
MGRTWSDLHGLVADAAHGERDEAGALSETRLQDRIRQRHDLSAALPNMGRLTLVKHRWHMCQ